MKIVDKQGIASSVESPGVIVDLVQIVIVQFKDVCGR